jgi:hypothetical protein
MAATIPDNHIWNGVEIGQCWICAVLWRPFWKWRKVEIFQCRESIRDIIIYPQIKFWWYRTMLNFCGINGCHNSGQIQHCSISTSWIDSRHRKISTSLYFQNGHHNTAKIQHWEIFRCQKSIRDIIIYPHIKWRWNRTMLNLCGIVAAILKMATGKNFSMSESICVGDCQVKNESESRTKCIGTNTIYDSNGTRWRCWTIGSFII